MTDIYMSFNQMYFFLFVFLLQILFTIISINFAVINVRVDR